MLSRNVFQCKPLVNRFTDWTLIHRHLAIWSSNSGGGHVLNGVAGQRHVFVGHTRSVANFYSTFKTRHKTSDDYNDSRQSDDNREFAKRFALKWGPVLAAIVGTTVATVAAKEEVNVEEFEEFGREIDGLKSYTAEEVAKHNDMSRRVWVSFRSGVYDITDFVAQHPGGDKILMASGGALEPFWTLFAVHKTREVFTIMEKYRIGNLDSKDRNAIKAGTDSTPDPYANDPIRHPILKARSQKPFNAEPPEELLVQKFITPKELFFVRNHLPVPEIDIENYTLEIEGFGLKAPKTLTLDEIKTKFPKHTVVSTIQCGGNRRAEMNKIKEVKGLSWGSAAISNAKWSGARLVDVLKYCDLDFDDKNIKHVQFDGLDFDVSSNPYGASVEALKALNPNADFLIAYEMNDEDIPADHGYPLRLIAPGVVGARNVKWLARIVLSDEESHSHWQRNDYKSFSPNIDWHNVDFNSAPAIQELPIQSAICEPREGQTVALDANRTIQLSGYAWSGGGRKVIRVDVTADEGVNWVTAELEQEDSPLNRTYSWTLWKANIPAPKEWKSGHKVELICRAADSHYNLQPENVRHLWNLRGVVNNSWHRVNVTIK
ncbi:unnamed protein product [Medioppia subpectinata]|uniref:sulfite oxidase n=1 Tax=Medioppia subpectinata TaxID=1979941 RepID=A0A7R9PWF0_9ACAR|nr:unnamed protein product [Medioppia subpectinata]CAG2102832.1 unnamed protein product [Medioppia subpectinata]